MLIGLLVFLLLLVTLLAIPLVLTFQVSLRDVIRRDIKLWWAFGLVRVEIPLAKSNAFPTTRGVAEGTSNKKPNILGIVRQERFLRRIIRFAYDVWSAVQKRNLRLLVRIGLGDPADTGRLWAVVGPVAGVLSDIQQASIRIEPEFVDKSFEMDSSGSIRLIPLQIIYLIFGLMLSREIWQGIRQLRFAT